MVEGFGVGLWGDLGGEPASASAWKMLPKPPQLGGGRGLVRRVSERERTEDAPEAARKSYERGTRWRAACPCDVWKLAEDCGPGTEPRGGGDRKGLEGGSRRRLRRG